MKLPSINLDLTSQLAEFDTWITPSLGEIQETERFQKAMDYVVDIFNDLAGATNNFARIEDFSPTAIADSFTKLIKDDKEQEARVKLESLAAVLFLVTGKTDNNSKCQLPLYLRDEADWENIPSLKRSKKTTSLEYKKLPRVLKAEAYMQIVASLAAYQEQQKKLLEEFIKFVLKDDSCISQLWSIGHSYSILKQFKKERDLLAPLVIFQTRGSVSASAGHKPETLLRQRLEEWGLQKNVDFNTTDVVIEANAATVSIEEVENAQEREETISVLVGEDRKVEEKIKNKTRAYDFVLPFNTPSWEPTTTKPQIFIQCQFYAGDSGSVSHKNLDQTDASRQYILSVKSNARFIEYVDGAGYFSSLNGDLKKLLSKPTTASFFQVRSAAIRLRRELQQIGFLIPLALEQAIVCSDGNVTNICQIITQAGYSQSEFNRCLDDCIQRKLIVDKNKLLLREDRRVLVRRYLLLDIVAIYGKSANKKSELTASIIIPGYGQFYGMKLTQLIAQARNLAPELREDWSNSEDIFKDIEWLCEEGLAILC